jgi:hypothetical protein
MAGETVYDLPPVDRPVNDDAKSDSGVESTAPTTSSPSLAAIKMADKKVLEMSKFFKKTTITEEEHKDIHNS